MEKLKQYRIELAPTLSGHWYSVFKQKKNKERFLGYFVSVTTVLNSYPFSEQLVKWMSEKGYHESKEIRDQAGLAGTKIHSAVERLLNGDTIERDPFKLEEWNKINSFVDWHRKYKPEVVATELPIFSSKLKVAGRVDCIAKIGDEMYVMDWKSSKSIHPSYYLQLAAYSQAVEEMTDLKINNVAVLQLGAVNKDHYRFVIESDWKTDLKVFKSVHTTWIYDKKREGDKIVEAPVLNLPDKLKL